MLFYLFWIENQAAFDADNKKSEGYLSLLRKIHVDSVDVNINKVTFCCIIFSYQHYLTTGCARWSTLKTCHQHFVNECLAVQEPRR